MKRALVLSATALLTVAMTSGALAEETPIVQGGAAFHARAPSYTRYINYAGNTRGARNSGSADVSVTATLPRVQHECVPGGAPEEDGCGPSASTTLRVGVYAKHRTNLTRSCTAYSVYMDGSVLQSKTFSLSGTGYVTGYADFTDEQYIPMASFINVVCNLAPSNNEALIAVYSKYL